MRRSTLRGFMAGVLAAVGSLPPAAPAQIASVHKAAAARPRLVVVIAVDQMRPDYLDRFRAYFGPGGFELFLQRGARFGSARYEHAITETCPGHAVILTGSYGMVNGIVANEWYDARLRRSVYCAEDSAAALVGSAGPGRSPRKLIGATVGDLLKTATAGRSRVIAVSGKDRSAIMLGGKLADAAWWTQDTAFVTSMYYVPELPAWVKAFNASGAFRRYIGTVWNRVLPAAAYAGMGRDDEPFESDVAGMGRTFPHPLRTARAVEYSPFGDKLVAEFAMRAVGADGLGRDTIPDLLAIGLSATDRVGHTFGPDSHEAMDNMVRLDRTLGRLFRFLDRTVGLANVTMVLTADHGVAPMPELAARGRQGGAGPGRLDPAVVDSAASKALSARFGAAPAPGWIAYDGSPILALREDALSARRVLPEAAESVAQAAVRAVPGVHAVLTRTALMRQWEAAQGGGPAGDVVRSFYPSRGGDLYYFLEPYWLPTADSTGTGHGSIWRYDQEVPLLWFGKGIVPGAPAGPAAVADIAPTLSALLGLPAPGGAQGRVLSEILR